MTSSLVARGFAPGPLWGGLQRPKTPSWVDISLTRDSWIPATDNPPPYLNPRFAPVMYIWYICYVCPELIGGTVRDTGIDSENFGLNNAVLDKLIIELISHL